jgi:mannose-1-phosphate guanylyltransferase
MGIVDKHGNMVIGRYNFTAFVGVRDTIFVYTTCQLILQKIFTQDVKMYILHWRQNSELLNLVALIIQIFNNTILYFN